jgi:hypothetical protein
MGMSADPNTVAGRLVERAILRWSAAPTGCRSLTLHWASFKQRKLEIREWKPRAAFLRLCESLPRADSRRAPQQLHRQRLKN